MKDILKNSREEEYLLLYRNLFLNSEKQWFQQHRWETTDAHYYSVDPSKRWYKPFSLDVIRQHLDGRITCSWLANNEDDECKWLAFDNDKDTDFLARIKTTFNSLGYTAHHESRREGREGHLWLFLDEPIKRESLCLFGDEIRRHAGINKHDVEMYPATSNNRSKLRGPLGINRKLGANKVKGIFEECTDDGAVAQLQWLSQQDKNSSEKIGKIADLLKERQPKPIERVQTNRLQGDFPDGFDSILSVIPTESLKQHYGQYIGRCPCCEIEGHDKAANNLHISNDGKMFCCWYGNQPGAIHTKAKIFEAAKALYIR